MLTKYQITYDPTEDDVDSIASYLKSSDGTLLTHTTTGPKEALDVHIAGSDITITADVDLDFATDSVDASGSEVSLDAATLAALENVVVSAVDLDIRDLAFATDTVDASGSVVALDAPTLAALENVTVSATDLDIRDLTHATDSVKIGDGTEFLEVNADGSINVVSAAPELNSCANSAVSVTTAATDLVATDLVNRKLITIQNRGTKAIFIGCDASVTTATGIEVPRGATAEFPMGPSINVHAITAAGTADVRIIELAS